MRAPSTTGPRGESERPLPRPVRLLAMDHALMLRLRDGVIELDDGSHCEEAVGEVLRGVADATLQHHAKFPRREPWGTYLTVDQETSQVVGVGGFKFAPTAAGEVEIAYYTVPPYEGRGYAKGTAAGLVEIAARSGVIKTVIADTLPEENASTHVLEYNRFRSTRETIMTDEGSVWRWSVSVCG